MFGELKVQLKNETVRRTLRSMFGEQTFAQLRTGLRAERYLDFRISYDWYSEQIIVPPKQINKQNNNKQNNNSNNNNKQTKNKKQTNYH